MSNKTPKPSSAKTALAPRQYHRLTDLLCRGGGNPKRIAAALGVLLLICLLLASLVVWLWQPRNLSLGNQMFSYEVVRSKAGLEKGLSGRGGIAWNHVMVFDYQTPQTSCLWMKDMRFPIDMVWLDDHKQVVAVRENVSPASYPMQYCAPAPVRYGIELRAGMVRHADIRVNQTASFD